MPAQRLKKPQGPKPYSGPKAHTPQTHDQGEKYQGPRGGPKGPPSAPPTSGAPPVATPPDPGQPPPISPQSMAARAAADRDYQLAEASGHNALYQAALQYGDPEAIAQFSQLGFGPAVTNNPNSTLSQIAEAERLGRESIQNSQNEQG